MNQFVFYNKFTVVNHKMFYDKELFTAGLWYISDLYNTSGDIIDFDVWKLRGVPVSKYVIWRGIVSKIKSLQPSRTNSISNLKHSKIMHIYNCDIELETASSRDLYVIIAELKKEKPTSFTKYATYINQLTEQETKSMFLISRICTRNIELQEFQYKVLHRYLPTNVLLYKMNKCDAKTCTFCNLYEESIIHLLYECLCVKDLWFHVQKVLSQCYGRSILLTCMDVIFGYNLGSLGKKSNMINNVILHTKLYIWKCKFKAMSPRLSDYKVNIHERFCLENSLALYNDTLQAFNI